MKAVMISIQPQWAMLIANGEKTIEVRKTRPKIDTPFKCYIYCCKAKDDYHILEWHDWDTGKITRQDGKVIGEFVCDRIEEYDYDKMFNEYCVVGYIGAYLPLKEMCLSRADLYDYAKGEKLYGWHISDLKIYDKPKEISEFKKYYRDCYYDHLGLATPKCRDCKDCNLTRPPQSWCYIEEN